VPTNPHFRKVLTDFQWYSIEEQVFFPRVLLREHCDLVHFPHFNVPLLYRRPFVVTVHDLILLRFPTLRATTLSPFLYRLKFLAYRVVIWNALVRSKRIITISEYTKRDILERYAISPKRVSVTYEATRSFCYTMRNDLARRFFESLNLLSQKRTGATFFRDILKPYALYVGNAYPHKNLEALLATFDRFPDGEARLVLVGGNDYFYRRLKAYVRKHGMSHVIFAGAISDEHLDLLYRHARVSVFPSLYEGFGLPPLEAMANGSPVIAAQASAFPEVLGDAAELFDPEDSNALRTALVAVWNDESLRASLRRKGFARVARFSWKKMGQETLGVYHEAMNMEK
jgi:glycosyltransferase involved in cell wall biosynthesis